jgi:DNA-directed RNA polymerase specialized sigma24 family protein
MDEPPKPFVRATEAPVEQERLGDLMMADAEPIIRRAVSRRLAGLWDDVDDVCSEARLELLLHLRRRQSDPAAASIDDFPAYVTTIATNACNHYFRRRRPGRARLRRQALYLLRQEPVFLLSQAPDGRTWCGLKASPARSRIADERALQQLAHDVEGDRNLVTVLERILDAAGGAIEFEALVKIVAQVWHIPPDPVDASAAVDMNEIPAPGLAGESAIDDRRFAERLWEEIRQLPRAQRVALLLNLRDGRGNSALSLFPVAGIAAFSDVARVLEISEADLSAIWVELPYDDNRIGRLLGCARQQVINLRMAAKKRLNTRLRPER